MCLGSKIIGKYKEVFFFGFYIVSKYFIKKVWPLYWRRVEENPSDYCDNVFIIVTLHGSSIFEYQGKNWPEEEKQETPQGQRPAQRRAEDRRWQTELSPRL